MSEETARHLAQLRQALAAGLLDEETFQAFVDALAKTSVNRAEQSGSGGVAQGEGSTAAGQEGVAVGGSVGGDILMPGARKEVHPPPQTEAEAAESRLSRLKQRYLEALVHHCNLLPLAALGQDEETGDVVRLDEVYVDLDTTSRVPLTEAEKKEEKYRYRSQEDRPLAALEAAAQATRLVILGDPGGGKSTFVRQIASKVAAGRLGQALPAGWTLSGWPMLTTLRDLAGRLAALELAGLAEGVQERRLVEAVEAQWRADMANLHAGQLGEHLAELLADEPLLLIFDGLDEVPEGVRPRVRRAVQAVLRAYPKVARVIVTCRVRSYSGGAVLPDFAGHTLAPFAGDKIEQFVAAWYQAQSRTLGQTDLAEQIADLQRAALSPGLRELAANPMLLTTMAIIHQREVGLPRERVRLYDMAVQILLSRWQKRKGLALSEHLRDLLGDDLKLRPITERLAYEAHRQQGQAGPQARLRRLDILGLLEEPLYLGDISLANEFLDYVDQRAGILVGEGGDEGGGRPQTYDFPHRTFQEYLAGCYLVSGRGIHRTYWEKVAEGDYWDLAGRLGAEELFYNRRNEQNLLDLAYDLCPGGEPASPAEWRAALWSGQMAVILGRAAIQADSGKPGGDATYLERLIPRLVDVVGGDHLSPLERAEAGQALAHLGDPRPGVGLRADGLPDIAWCEVSAGPFVMGSKDDSLNLVGKETPQREVDVPAYQISRHPVTNAQYEAFVRDGGYSERWRHCWTEAGWDWKEDLTGPGKYGGVYDLPNHPLVMVSWYEAAAFCRWLTEKLRSAKIINVEQVIRLPSEVEWEKAARGTDGRLYPWGDEIDPNRVNYRDAGIGTSSAVGCFPRGASPYGCEDIVGNAWEWCQTKWEEDYEAYRDDNASEGAAARVLRGGAFDGNGGGVRCAVRSRSRPRLRSGRYGFRVLLSPLPLSSEPSGL